MHSQAQRTRLTADREVKELRTFDHASPLQGKSAVPGPPKLEVLALKSAKSWPGHLFDLDFHDPAHDRPVPPTLRRVTS
jgi:hypothetical protein